MYLKYSGWLPASALLLLFGCSHLSSSSSVHQKITKPVEQSALQSPVRAIIYFRQSPSDNRQLAAAIADACHCQPVFFRPYPGDALIYEIALPQGLTFSSFETGLMRNAAQFGIKAVEPDGVMQRQ